MKPVIAPAKAVGRILLRIIGVPLYRLVFFLKRQLGRILMPAKNRVTYFISNRYAIHVAVVAIATMTGSTNIGGSDVRAETFGTHSMLYALVATDPSASIDVVSAGQFVAISPSSYGYDDGAIDPLAHLDTLSEGDGYATTTVGGTAVSAPSISEGHTPEADRTSIETYVVSEGDTLYGIAQKFGLNLTSLLWANNLTVRSLIKPGQDMKIVPVNGVLYTVKKGDTISKITKNYGSESDKIIAFNKLASANDLKIGETLMLPDGEPPFVPAPVVRPLAVKTPSSSQTLTGKPTTNTAPLSGFTSGSGTWVWPTDWHVITQYYGWKHTGIDIDGDYTTFSFAASDGVIIYSGWRNGYGNTVEIDHGNGIVTRYAHHSKLFVNVGDIVTVGQKLAQTGSTGRSTGTHLHFEVIKNGKFQNPLVYVR